MRLINIPHSLAVTAVKGLSDVDYSVATRVSEDVAVIVQWAFVHDKWWLAEWSIDSLKFLDDFGSFLITVVAWLIHNSV